MSKYKSYRKTAIQPMRPYVPSEDMTGICVSPDDVLEEGGMIAVNPRDHSNSWYVSRDFFLNNYVEV